MLLLSGPPGSGRTSRILEEFRQALRSNASDIRLLTPTATLAEHLRHKLAREGFVLRPGLILTLSKFIAPWVEDLPEISPAGFYLLVERVAHRLAPAEFARVLGAPGFCAALAQAMEEFSGAGCDSGRLERSLPRTPFGPAFLVVFREVERELARRGLGLRSARLERAARRIAERGLGGVNTVWMDGFLALTDPELAVVRAIGAQARLTVTLPEGTPAMGFEEQRMERVRMERVRVEPAVESFSAPTVDREATEIARRILLYGTPFSEIGIIVRNPDVYLAPLRAALERFGIPARFYFSGPLAEHGTAQFLAAVVDALTGGWDHAATLAALRLSGGGVAVDRFDFAARERLPGRGLDGLRQLTEDARLRELLDAFAAMDSWRGLALMPSQWASRLERLRALVQSPEPGDGASREMAALWRGQAAALDAFEAALGEAAQSLEDTRRIPLDEFWTAVKAVLRLTQLRVPDRRRNVVHVLSVFEARQWELKAVFVCGLAELQFPRRHAQEPLFPDAVRRRLAEGGIRVRMAEELEQEERLLFELARTRASGTVTLSYAETDSRGGRNAPSRFLDRAPEPCGEIVRPAWKPAGKPAADRKVCPTFRTFSPSGLECFLDCPFQFFARYTLKLRGRPLAPQDRLDFMMQGTIVHQTLSEWHGSGGPVEPLFERIFSESCRKKAVFLGYKTEYLRRQMLDDLRRFCEVLKLPATADVVTEWPFEMPLDNSLVVRGRIDRIDKLPDGRARIVDYKYSAAARVVDKLNQATLVQGGLYALAVERLMGLEPAGMFYYGLKKELKIAGWSDPTREWIDEAVLKTRAAAEQIRGGRIAPSPSSLELCGMCEYCDVCRYSGAARTMTAG